MLAGLTVIHLRTYTNDVRVLCTGYAPMARWSQAACAGASSFGMSGTNAYAAVLTPQDPTATAANGISTTVWERSRWDSCDENHSILQ